VWLRYESVHRAPLPRQPTCCTGVVLVLQPIARLERYHTSTVPSVVRYCRGGSEALSGMRIKQPGTSTGTAPVPTSGISDRRGRHSWLGRRSKGRHHTSTCWGPVQTESSRVRPKRQSTTRAVESGVVTSVVPAPYRSDRGFGGSTPAQPLIPVVLSVAGWRAGHASAPRLEPSQHHTSTYRVLGPERITSRARGGVPGRRRRTASTTLVLRREGAPMGRSLLASASTQLIRRQPTSVLVPHQYR